MVLHAIWLTKSQIDIDTVIFWNIRWVSAIEIFQAHEVTMTQVIESINID